VAQNPDLIAALKTSPDAAYRHMVDVLDQLHSARAQRISLQLLEPGSR
jgi:biopolymer transport protein ExbD